ncbi:MAG: hypothetical protein KDD94_07450 [Calditrichaeota bacterium]|nr:hypothetical protein [Calditrichota bacterium]
MSDLKALVICHGYLAEQLLEVVKSIIGHTDMLVPFSNVGKSLAVLKEEVKTFIDSQHIKQAIFFVDLKGGSCWSASCQVLQDVDGVAISGVNVPMLINFVSKKEQFSTLDEFVIALSESGKNAITWSPR